MDGLRTRLDQMSEIVSDYRYDNIIVNALSTKYNYVINMSCSDRDFDLESIGRATKSMLIDNLCSTNRNGTKSVIGRGTAMQAAARRLTSD